LNPQLTVVVDLTIEDDHQITTGVRHRLGTTSEIHNGESAMPEMHSSFLIDEISLCIWPTVGQSPSHSLQGLPVIRPIRPTGGNESRDPAHQLIGKFLVCFTR
jgi:hypothetical protein